MSRQIDELMPQHGYKQHDELDGAPEYVFLPARPPSVRERIPIHNDSCFARALTHDSCAPSTGSRSMTLFTPSGHYLAPRPLLTSHFWVTLHYMAGAEAHVPDGFVLVPKSIYQAPLEKTLLTLSGPPTRRLSTA